MARGRLGEGLDAVEHGVEGDLERPGLPLDLGQQQAARGASPPAGAGGGRTGTESRPAFTGFGW